MLRCWILVVAILLGACTKTADPDAEARVLLMGDSLMASNRALGVSVASALEIMLGEQVIDRSASGAGVIARRGIPQQFVEGPWDWVVLNGYGNDLLFGCGCGACEGRMDRLVSTDGSGGAIPDLVRELRSSGARIIYTGYLRTPGFASPIEACVALGDEMDTRLGAMAALDDGVTFLSLADLVPNGDKTYHAPDRVHPSGKGSAAIADRIAKRIAENEQR